MLHKSKAAELIPLRPCDFSVRIKSEPIHILRLPGVEAMAKTVCALCTAWCRTEGARNIMVSAVSPVELPQLLYRYYPKPPLKKLPVQGEILK